MFNKLVSIILPVYNGEKYLETAIKSILNQTYKDLELIVVDDKSSDRSLQIAREFELIDSRVKVIVNDQNLKLPLSLNKGFAVARGEYLTWTSDDNIYYQNALYEMVHFLENHKEYFFVYADMERIDSRGTCIGYTKSEKKDIFLYNCVGACFLYRKECKETIGDYNPELFLVEDYDYWIRISQNYKICHIPQILYSYRLHNESLTMSKMKRVGEQLLKIKLKYFDYLFSKVSNDDKENFIFELLVYDVKCLDNKENISDMVSKMKKMIPQNNFNKDGRVYLYGAGSIGQEALNYFEDSNIEAFIDGDKQKVGKSMLGHDIISIDEVTEKNIPVIITTDVRTSYSIILKLRKYNIQNYEIFYRIL